MAGADVKRYSDDSFEIVGNTIIAYYGAEEELVLSHRYGDSLIQRIGDGAFMESDCLRRITVPFSVKEIGDKAFFDCKNLEESILPGTLKRIGDRAFRYCHSLKTITIDEMNISADEYQSLKNTAIKMQENTYVTRKFPEIDLLQKIKLNMDAKAAANVPDDVPFLFRLDRAEEPKCEGELSKEIQTIGFSAPIDRISEKSALYRYTIPAPKEVIDSITEQKNDLYVRLERANECSKTVIFTFDDSKTMKIENGYSIEAKLRTGYFFRQSVQRVMYDGKLYYVYRRYYLSPDPEKRYDRRDIAIFTDDGIVYDKTEVRKVYAKYKLLSIL